MEFGATWPLVRQKLQRNYYKRSGLIYDTCKTTEPGNCDWTGCGNDIQFVLDLTDHVKSLIPDVQVWAPKLILSGESTGGMFTYYFASKRPDMVSGIAPVYGGTMNGLPQIDHQWVPTQQHNIDIYAIFATNDATIPPYKNKLWDAQVFLRSEDVLWTDLRKKQLVSGDSYFYVPAIQSHLRWAASAGCTMEQLKAVKSCNYDNKNSKPYTYEFQLETGQINKWCKVPTSDASSEGKIREGCCPKSTKGLRFCDHSVVCGTTRLTLKAYACNWGHGFSWGTKHISGTPLATIIAQYFQILFSANK